ncbi:uncharacterized protein LOC117893725 [Drosophila subobscura]|uniref:uncharacterized protein LOC117893725 n=1 Tax=Drosophila subobscura TaxID=7241 RepID=UPI00155B132B|nr:uncharacterized protein LOC117893725 [Drosophila subobscura]
MPLPRELDYEQRERLQHWLGKFELELDHRTRTQLSDALAVAKLFERVHPGRVDFRCYVARSSLALKKQNWHIFNVRTLKRMNMSLSQRDLYRLASGSSWALETLLHKLMMTDDEAARAVGGQELDELD